MCTSYRQIVHRFGYLKVGLALVLIRMANKTMLKMDTSTPPSPSPTGYLTRHHEE
ncbi:hypothetical protein [Arthrobacter sp. U41]|uniref:hypothetical protein n=1 Tax=Arthrobacter sp. U41 TaxID=1849032 RepID=UPI0012F8B459|nr:hypothetical protein [Arthrobacter sp. U41]